MSATIGGVETEAARSYAAPAELKHFRNYHKGETILVCGCGSSLNRLVCPDRFVTIGVNDIGRLFQPDYLVVLNSRHQFAGDRYRYVEESRAQTVFSQLALHLPHAPVVHVRLGRRGGVDDVDPSVLHYTRNSPYLAMCLAMHMGAARIGLIGVDFTDHHFFGKTGRHNLAGEFEQIDREYRRLADECSSRGIEVFNLSQESRLTAFPKLSPEDFAALGVVRDSDISRSAGRRIFFVHYRFLSCGEVFRDGLERSANDLGVEYESAVWDDAALAEKVGRFQPDLLFVVHGRRFYQRWKNAFEKYNSAVWLLDEPYEVDDTSRFSGVFRTVFVSDPGTLSRHRNAHYLPVCYDPRACVYPVRGDRPYRVGFVGGANPAREKFLSALARRDLLSYVVGGPWSDPALGKLNLSGNIPASETARLYRDTEIILNVFRTRHHFNRQQAPVFSLNPRIYEAAGCGALPVSEPRPELMRLWPEAPIFSNEGQLVETLQRLRDNPWEARRLRRSAVRAFREHTYACRLSSAIALTLDARLSPRVVRRPPAPQPPVESAVASAVPPIPGWDTTARALRLDADGVMIIEKEFVDVPGSEEGMIALESHADTALECEVWIEPGAHFLAKIRQQEARNQSSNSYHLSASRGGALVARHHHVFRRFTAPENQWIRLKMIAVGGRLVVSVNEEVVCSVRDSALQAGYCFLGVKGGRVRLRSMRVTVAAPEELPAPPASTEPAYVVLAGSPPKGKPLVSIITTVYDRTECLERCIRSTNALTFQDYEHIIVADSPPPQALEELTSVVARRNGAKDRLFANLKMRHNNWGIAPAAAGLALASGKYVAFLSDDNGYLPGHFEPLIETLENNPEIGFAYSSCMYAGRAILRNSPPRFGRIDLGQPLFRKGVLDQHFGGALPFAEAAWDWRMIELLMRKGARWKHVDRLTFIFRLEKYPHLIVSLP